MRFDGLSWAKRNRHRALSESEDASRRLSVQGLVFFSAAAMVAVAGVHAAESSLEKARLARVLRLETMIDIREICDAAEEVVPADLWTLATYKELLFLDSHTVAEPEFFGE